MLWHAQHGATAEQYRATLQERGAPIPTYLIPPEPIPGVHTWFLAFWELSTERRFPSGPIPWSAIQAYPTSDRDAFHSAMRDADRAYLEFLSRPEEQRASLPVAGPDLLRAIAKT